MRLSRRLRTDHGGLIMRTERGATAPPAHTSPQQGCGRPRLRRAASNAPRAGARPGSQADPPRLEAAGEGLWVVHVGQEEAVVGHGQARLLVGGCQRVGEVRWGLTVTAIMFCS